MSLPSWSSVMSASAGQQDPRYTLTVILRVLDRKEVRLLWVGPAATALVEVAASVAKRDARVVVSEILAVELEELDEEDAEVGHRVDLCAPDLGMDLGGMRP